MRIVGTRPAARCAVCHDDLDLLAVACAGCASVGHVGCWAELGRCSTLGCARSGQARRPVAVAPVAVEQWRWFPYCAVELLVVTAIIGLLAAVVTVNVMGQGHGPRVQRPAADMKAIRAALELYKVDCGRYPDRLDALWIRPPGLPRWGPEPYLKEYPPKDPWGNEYQYVPPYGVRRFEIVSFGADGAPGGQDECSDLSSRTINNEDTGG
jgi:general secretion pathway protein G